MKSWSRPNEELQSLNEELSTVNCQLLEKVAELDKSTSEMTNLMVSTEIAALYLDSQTAHQTVYPTCRGPVQSFAGRRRSRHSRFRFAYYRLQTARAVPAGASNEDTRGDRDPHQGSSLFLGAASCRFALLITVSMEWWLHLSI